MRLISRVLTAVVIVTLATLGTVGAALAADKAGNKAGNKMGKVSATDAKWAAMMVPHHRDGIELADLALRKASSSGVKEVARKSKREQEAQLPRLRAVARSDDRSEEQPEKPLRRFNDEQMTRLKSLLGTDFDRYWLDVFRSHHISAIMMTNTALAGTAGGEARRLQREIRSGQLDEVQTMNELPKELSRASRS